jgi:hypothetical protein
LRNGNKVEPFHTHNFLGEHQENKQHRKNVILV